MAGLKTSWASCRRLMHSLVKDDGSMTEKMEKARPSSPMVQGALGIWWLGSPLAKHVSGASCTCTASGESVPPCLTQHTKMVVELRARFRMSRSKADYVCWQTSRLLCRTAATAGYTAQLSLGSNANASFACASAAQPPAASAQSSPRSLQACCPSPLGLQAVPIFKQT